MQEVAKYKDCFVCGDRNQAGLKARFYVQDDGSVVSELLPDERFQGYRDILHGGILAAMLDEVMIKTILAKGVFSVTAELAVKFKRPAKTGQRIRFTGRIVDENRRIFRTVGSAVNEEGQEVATAKATYLEAKGDLKSSLTASLE
jgi:uncharacterized protein (TIGR00369 family)